MKLQKQLQILVNNAPESIPPQIIEKGITPVLKELVKPLKHLQYYILQNSEEDWLLTTINHRENPEIIKKVIYAFAKPQDALIFQGETTEDYQPFAIPVTHLLFQVLAFKELDSLIFMDNSRNLNKGIEITRDELMKRIDRQLKQLPKQAFA